MKARDEVKVKDAKELLKSKIKEIDMALSKGNLGFDSIEKLKIQKELLSLSNPQEINEHPSPYKFVQAMIRLSVYAEGSKQLLNKDNIEVLKKSFNPVVDAIGIIDAFQERKSQVNEKTKIWQFLNQEIDRLPSGSSKKKAFQHLRNDLSLAITVEEIKNIQEKVKMEAAKPQQDKGWFKFCSLFGKQTDSLKTFEKTFSTKKM